jgi:hypothetical protein
MPAQTDFDLICTISASRRGDVARKARRDQEVMVNGSLRADPHFIIE